MGGAALDGQRLHAPLRGGNSRRIAHHLPSSSWGARESETAGVRGSVAGGFWPSRGGERGRGWNCERRSGRGVGEVRIVREAWHEFWVWARGTGGGGRSWMMFGVA